MRRKLIKLVFFHFMNKKNFFSIMPNLVILIDLIIMILKKIEGWK